jgi:hypothetical protein
VFFVNDFVDDFGDVFWKFCCNFRRHGTILEQLKLVINYTGPNIKCPIVKRGGFEVKRD